MAYYAPDFQHPPRKRHQSDARTINTTSPYQDSDTSLSQQCGSSPETSQASNKDVTLGQEAIRATTESFIHQQPNNKRRKGRAVTACEFCRVRKTKCDNIRPKCTYCVRHGAKCTYDYGEDHTNWIATTSKAATTTRPSEDTMRVLEKLEDIKNLLMIQRRPLDDTSRSLSHQQLLTLPGISEYRSRQDYMHVLDTEQRSQNEAVNSVNSLWLGRIDKQDASTYRAARTESLLRWPALSSITSEKARSIESFVFEDDEDPTRRWDPLYPRTLGGHELGSDEALHAELETLCQRFLLVVYPRNPILDRAILGEHLKSIKDNGLAWDSASCLVLVSCALAAFSEIVEPPSRDGKDIDGSETCHYLEAEDMSLAESYYAG